MNNQLPEDLKNYLRDKYKQQLDNPEEKLDIISVLIDIDRYNKEKALLN